MKIDRRHEDIRALATRIHGFVTPAKAGAQLPPSPLVETESRGKSWIQAFAGMTTSLHFRSPESIRRNDS
jgi:hypothetical protein